MPTEQKVKKTIFRRLLKIIFRLFLVVFILFVGLVLFIRSPWGQDLIITQVTSYVSDKIESEFSVQKFYLGFDGNLIAEGIYLEDQNQKELAYIGNLAVEIPLYAILKNKEINIYIEELSEVRANIYRTKNEVQFNYAFIIDAFSSEESKEETAPSKYQIKFSSGLLKEITLDYVDEVEEEKHHAKLTSFFINFNEFNLDENIFHIGEIKLSNFEYVGKIKDATTQESALVEASEEDFESDTPLVLSITHLDFSNVNIDFLQENNLHLVTSIPALQLDKTNLVVADKQLAFNQLSWENVSLNLTQWIDDTATSQENPEIKEEATPHVANSLWPEWEVRFSSLATKNSNYEIRQLPTSTASTPQLTNLANTNVVIRDFELQPNEEVKFELNEFSTHYNDLFRLQKFGFTIEMAQHQIAVSELQLQTPNSYVEGKASFQYDHLNAFDAPENNFKKLELGLDYSIDISDHEGLINAFDIEIDEALFSSLANARFNGSFLASGEHINQLQVDFANQWNATKLFTKLDVTSVTSPKHTSVNVKEFTFSSTSEDLYLFLPKEEAYRLPERLSLKASGNYKAEKLALKASFQSELGDFSSDIKLDAKNETYQISMSDAWLNVGGLLQNESIGKLHFKLFTEGNGFAIEKAKNELDLEIKTLEVANLNVANIVLSSEYKNGIGILNLGIQDSLMQAHLASSIVYENEELQVGWTLQLDGMDLEGLQLADESIKIRGKLSGEILQDKKGVSLEAKATEIAGLRDKRTYVLHKFDLSAKLWEELTEVSITGDFIDANLNSSANVEQSLASVLRYIEDQLAVYNDHAEEEKPAPELTKNPVEIELNAQFYDNNFLREVIIPDLVELDTLQFNFSFSEEKQQLAFAVQLPFVEYANNQLKGFEIKGEGNATQLSTSLGVTSLVTSVFAIDDTQLKAIKDGDVWEVNFAIEDEARLLFNLGLQIDEKEKGMYRLQIHPENLILNAVPWDISAENELVFGKQILEANHFSIERNEQKLGLSHELGFEEPHFGLLFSDFKVGTFTSFIKSEKENLASGTIKGDVTLIKPFGNWGLVSDLQVQEIHIFERLIGNFELMAEASSAFKYNLALSLIGPEIDFNAEGKLTTEGENKRITTSFNMEKVNMPLIEYFSKNAIRNSEGKLSANGKFSLMDGETTYEAKLNSSQVFFNLRALNADLYLGDETIELNNKGLFFTKFNLQDANKNSFSLSGSIENLMTKPQFLLDAEAKNFQLLNSTKADNELYFGTLNFDATAKVRGDIQLPKINLYVQINKNTNLTYVVPQTQLEVVEREGVVVFVNKENELDLFNQTQQEELKAEVRGIDINALVKISPKATINVLLNERTGDNLRVQGGGDLQVNVRPNGTINLSGKYEASEGHFELNLYNLVRRRFTLAPNSSIVWSGDPLNADLDIRAIYKVETSPSTLMAAQLISESPAVQNRYRQQLPFLVYLDVSGEINAPELDFSLDMPSGERAAIGGSVFAKITQINQQEDERNKQVFALLVLNQFYPESGSDGSQGGATALARNNINQALSEQLNTFSNKMLKNSGVVLNFDLNSYTDFQTGAANDRTDLDVSAQKKLFNDRLVVEAGSQINVQGDQRPGESNVALGNVSVEYLLTRDERWKLRGFRRNEYENIIDGQLVFSGIALIFTKEFNEFQELWKSFLSAEDEVQSDENEVKNKNDNSAEEQEKKEQEEPTKKNREKAN